MPDPMYKTSYTGIVFKRALSQKICLQIDAESCEWGFVSDISWPEMKSIVGNDNRRVKQTMHHFKYVAILRKNLYHATFRILLFY